MTVKRGYLESSGARCQVLLVVRDRWVVIDGLNGNVDVFTFLEFDYVTTLDINEEVLSAAVYVSEIP